MKKTYAFLLLMSLFTFGFGQTIATVDRENGPGPTATDNVVSMSSIGLTRGSGVNQAFSPGNVAFASNNYTPGGDRADAIDNGDYIEWSVTANTGFRIILEDLDIRLRRNNNGPSNWQLYYSLDGFTTPGSEVAIGGPQTIANTSTSFNMATLAGGPLGIDSGITGTITFRVYAWGAVANSGDFRVIGQPVWALTPAVPEPGIRMLGTLVPPSDPISIDSDIVSSSFPPLVEEENIDYTEYNVSSGLDLINSLFIGAFTIRDGGSLSPDADSNPTIVDFIQFNVTNSDNIAALAIFDEDFPLVPIAEVTTVNNLTSFNGLNLIAPDDGTKTFFVTATFKSVVTDNDQIQLTIASAITPPNGTSLFTASNAGGAATSVAGDINRIEVEVNQFEFVQQPTDGNAFELIYPFPTILAVDANLNVDVDANITDINVITVIGSSIVPETYTMTNGVAVFDNVVFTSTESNISLIANAPPFSGTSAPFNISGPLINVARQNFDTETGWAYTSDRPFFGTVSDWANGLGYFGEIALADAGPIDNPLFNEEIFGENALNTGTVNPYATLTFETVDVSFFDNNSILFDWQVVGYEDNPDDVDFRLIIDGIANNWQPVFDGSVNPSADDEGRIKIGIPDGSSTVGLQVRIRNNSADGYSGFDNFRLVSEFSGLIYTDSGGWENNIAPDETTGALDALVIDGIYNLSGDVQINNFIIQSAGTTEIPVAQSLVVNGILINNGALTLNSVSNTYSSLIVNGSSRGNVTYNRYVNQFADTGSVTGSNDLISAPVTSPGQDFLSLRNANPDIPAGTIGGVPTFLFGPFDNVANDYVNYTSANDTDLIEPGIGYRTGSTQTGGSTFTFVGNVITDSPSVPITAATSRFNLIGNPFPSYIRLDGFLAANSTQFDPGVSGVYGYSGDFTDGFTIWNQAFSDMNPNAVIAPGQGFFVSSQAGGGTISFPTTIRSIGTADDFIPGRMANPEDYIKHIKLRLEQNDHNYFTDVYFTDNATLGMDSGYDSALFGDIPQVALYSKLVQDTIDAPMGVQSVDFNATANVSIPLGLHAVAGQQLNITISESTLPSDVEVYLEDRLHNTSTLLNDIDYIATPNVTLSGTGRYYLTFSSNQLGVGELDLSNLRITAQANPKTITISGTLNTETKAEVYDIQGRLMLQQQLRTDTSVQTIDASNLTGGIYIVKLQNASTEHSQKVILK